MTGLNYRQRMRVAAQFKRGDLISFIAAANGCDGRDVEDAIRAVLVAVDRTGRAPREYTRALEVLERKDERARRRAK